MPQGVWLSYIVDLCRLHDDSAWIIWIGVIHCKPGFHKMTPILRVCWWYLLRVVLHRVHHIKLWQDHWILKPFAGLSSSVLLVTIDNRANYKQHSIPMEPSASLGGGELRCFIWYHSTSILQNSVLDPRGIIGIARVGSFRNIIKDLIVATRGMVIIVSAIVDPQLKSWSLVFNGFVDGGTIQYVLL